MGAGIDPGMGGLGFRGHDDEERSTFCRGGDGAPSAGVECVGLGDDDRGSAGKLGGRAGGEACGVNRFKANAGGVGRAEGGQS